MKKRFLLTTVLCLFASPAAAIEVDFVYDIKPIGFLFSPEADNFEVKGAAYEWVRGDADVSYNPSLKFGAGLDFDQMFLDFTGGVGWLVNDLFETTYLTGDVALRFKKGRAVTFGPHLGFLAFNEPDVDYWDDFVYDQRVYWLDETTGILIGLDFRVGGEPFGFSLNVNYLDAAFEVRTAPWATANMDEIDLSGFSLQMGIMGHF